MSVRIFEFDDYKAFLKAKISSEASVIAGYKSRLAKAMQAPQSFLSQVLHTHVHLSPDHAFRLAVFWRFGEDEQSYFLTLLQLARSGSREYRSFLHEQLQTLRKQNADLSRRFKQPTIETTEQQWIYFTAWHLSAIHLLLTIPEFQNPKAISKRLGLDLEIVSSGLQTLESMGLAQRKKERWVTTKKSLHLSKTSPASAANHQIWRQRAINDIYQPQQKNLHYTSLQTLSRADAEKAKEILLQAIETIRGIVVASPEEDLVCFTCDLFSV